MRVVSFDTETDLIRPGRHAPALVCVTWQFADEAKPHIAHHTEAEPLLAAWLEDPNIRLVGHNVAFDFAVIAERFPALRILIFQAYAEDRVTDTMIRQWLLDTAAGVYQRKIRGRRQTYALEDLARRCAGIQLQKDAWRLSYVEFIDTPLTGWIERARVVKARAAERIKVLEDLLESWAELSKAARERAAEAHGGLKALEKELQGLRDMWAAPDDQCLRYPLEDARATLAVYLAQEKHAVYLDDQYRQVRAYWALSLSSIWGICTDAPGVAVLRRETEAELEDVKAVLLEAGLVRPNGTRDTKAAKARMLHICARDHLPIPRTEAHDDCELGDACTEHVCLDAESCNETDDPILIAYAKLSELTKVLSNDVAALENGILYPLHTRYGFAATGRTTSSKPNIQNVRRRAGIREAYIPRPGMVYFECDYPQLELYALAQCCVTLFGWSKLADALNAGLDVHLWMAAKMLGLSYEQALANKSRPDVKRARQLSKVANFGFPGGLGADSFIEFAKSSMKRSEFDELGLTPASVKALKAQWLETWPEMRLYFDRVNTLCDNDSGLANVVTLFTNRHRGAATYCSACNNGFQALGSDCAKEAAWRIAREQYAVPDSPLFNTRTVAFVHDEFIGEVEEGARAHEAAYRLADVMREAANIYLTDVPIPAEKMKPVLMYRWAKDAESTFDAAGRLVPWAA